MSPWENQPKCYFVLLLRLIGILPGTERLGSKIQSPTLQKSQAQEPGELGGHAARSGVGSRIRNPARQGVLDPGAWCVWGAPPQAEVESMREWLKGPIMAVRFTMKNRIWAVNNCVKKPDLGGEKHQ